MAGGLLSSFSGYLIIAEWRGWEKEDRWKERGRVREMTAQECVCV